MADENLEYPKRGYDTQDVRTQVEEEKKKRGGRRWLWIALGSIILAPTALFALWAAITLGYSYSRGDRVGYVQKFSQRGWLCKTWEGELAMTTVPGTAPQLFEFSVRDDSIAAVIEELMRTRDGRVSITYEQHKGVPSSCFGDTEYHVVEARGVGPATTPAPAGPGATPSAPAAPLPAPGRP